MKNSGTKEINTKDLKLRKFVMEDAEMMYNNWATDKETVKHLEWEVHKDLNERLLEIDKTIYNKVSEILKYHIDVRHIRGGESTRQILIKKRQLTL